MIARPLPWSPWFRWAPAVLWNGEWRLTGPVAELAPEMTPEERETFWAAFAMCGLESHG